MFWFFWISRCPSCFFVSFVVRVRSRFLSESSVKITAQIFLLYRIEQPAQCNSFLMREPGERERAHHAQCCRQEKGRRIRVRTGCIILQGLWTVDCRKPQAQDP